MSEEGVNIKECLNCGKRFCGRSDKKFCSDYCRTSYNNNLYRSRRAALFRVDRILRKNHEILDYLHQKEISGITESELNNLGYDMKYFTSLPESHPKKRGEKVLQCYDYILYIDKKHRVTVSKSE